MAKLLTGTVVSEFSDSFPLPLTVTEFGAKVRAELIKYYTQQRDKLAASLAAQLFPRGQSATLLAKLYSSPEPSLVAQEEDGTWDAHSCDGSETNLPGDGRVWHCMRGPVGSLFRLQYPGGGIDEHRYKDSKEFLDLLLRGSTSRGRWALRPCASPPSGPRSRSPSIVITSGASGRCAPGRSASATPTSSRSRCRRPTATSAT